MIVMITEFKHAIGEKITLIRESVGVEQEVSIRRVSDGFWFNFLGEEFQEYLVSADNSYRNVFEDFEDNEEFRKLEINNLPPERMDLLFVYRDIDVDGQGTVVETYERHVFGGRDKADEPDMCVIYGTLRDVSNRPLVGQKVEAYLNRAGYFTHKAGLIGYAATVLTDESGYFEIPLIQKLDVTINVPVIGFTQRGFVPTLSSVELSTETLLSYLPRS